MRSAEPSKYDWHSYLQVGVHIEADKYLNLFLSACSVSAVVVELLRCWLLVLLIVVCLGSVSKHIAYKAGQ